MRKKVLFVCTGNTCRSPMAQGIYNSISDGAFSRGLMVWGAAPASDNAVIAMEKMGIDISDHISRGLSVSDLKECDLCLTMTQGHKNIILSHFPEYEDKVFTLGEYAGGADVPDPYGMGVEEYVLCAEKIREYINKVLEKDNGNDNLQ